MDGVWSKAYVDTGASATLIADTLLSPSGKASLKKYTGKVYDASGHTVPILGEARINVVTSVGSLDTNILVFEKNRAINYDVLIGMDILKHTTINFDSREIKFTLTREPQYKPEGTSGVMNLTILSHPYREKISNDCSQEKVYISTVPILGLPEVEGNNLLLVNLDNAATNFTAAYKDASCNEPGDANEEKPAEIETVEMQPNMEENVTYINEGEMQEIKIYLREDLEITNNTLMVTSALISPQLKNGTEIVLPNSQLTDYIAIARVVTRVADNYIKINVINVGDKSQTLKKGTLLCTAQNFLLSQTIRKATEKIETAMEAPVGDLMPLKIEDINCDNTQYSEQVVKVLNQHRNACWLPGESLGKYKGDQLEIKLKTEAVVNKAPYRVPHAHQSQLDEYIKGLLKEGLITLSKSSYNSPLIIVKRGDGGIRPCMDYRELNELIEPVSFPLPRITDLLNSLGQSVYISTLDLKSAYHQCEIRPCDREKTAFTVKNTKYEWTRVPFGLQSSPGFFARVINEILYDILGPQCLAYMDDIVLFSKTPEQHLDTINEVMFKLESAGIKLKIKKCRFFASKIKFLGYEISKDGMSMSKDRVDSIKNMPLPTNKKQLQSFLGVVNYFRIFIHKFTQICEPLYDLLRKGVTFLWTPAHTESINLLKKKLIIAPIMRFPNYDVPFHIHTDASNAGIAAVLMQEHNGLLHPLAYVSKTITKAQRNYSATKKEALALTFALNYFRHIILCYKVHVYTDHKPLLGVLRKPSQDDCLTRWSLSVQEYAIKMHYLEGKKNIFADALSRLPDPNKSTKDWDKQLHDELNESNILCDNMTQDKIHLLNEYIPEKVPWDDTTLRNAQRKDSSCMQLIHKLEKRDNTEKSVEPPILADCLMIKGTLYIIRKIKRSGIIDQHVVPYIPDSLMREAFKLMHLDATAGHKGPERTLKMFVRNFYNAHERPLITQYCDECELCIKAKKTPKKIPIRKFPVPIRPFDTISSDILGPLRITEQGHQYILTVRDFTTRYTILFCLKNKDTDTIIGALRQVISNYGSSRILLSDNAQEYVSTKLANFLKYYNTKKVQIAPYHPASQGLAERINREVAKLLRIYTTQLAINDWDVLMPVIQLTINNTYNASIQETPFFALFGYDSGTVTLTPPKLNYGEDELTQHMQRVSQIRQHCRERLLQAQASYTELTNVGRHIKSFKVGQRVYAKITKHQQTTRQKLDLPVSGPFTIISGKGYAWNLKESSSGKMYTVHPDYIIQTPKQRGNAKKPDTHDIPENTDSQLGETTVSSSLSPIIFPISGNRVPEENREENTSESAVPENENLESPVPKEKTESTLPPVNPPIRIQPPRACKK